MIDNPFVTTAYVSDEYFCDREQETAELIKLLTNGNNVALISPRRMGKTGLLYHCFAQKEMQQYYTFLVDIYATKSLHEFVYELGKAILGVLKPRGRKVIEQFTSIVSSFKTGIHFDAWGQPSWNLELGDIQTPNVTLDEIFRYLEQADRPCIVAIDEFQAVSNYPEQNVEAVLRTYVQRCKQTRFIFSGSQRSMMREMFLSAARPFYQSVTTFSLNPIALQKYTEFAQYWFTAAKKAISEEAVRSTYEQFDGTTWYLQKVMNELFASSKEQSVCGEEEVGEAIQHLLGLNDYLYQDILYQLSTKQKELLYALAREGGCKQITSSRFIQKYRLAGASSVQKAAAVLLDKQILTNELGTYQVYDKFFALWLQQN